MHFVWHKCFCLVTQQECIASQFKPFQLHAEVQRQRDITWEMSLVLASSLLFLFVVRRCWEKRIVFTKTVLNGNTSFWQSSLPFRAFQASLNSSWAIPPKPTLSAFTSSKWNCRAKWTTCKEVCFMHMSWFCVPWTKTDAADCVFCSQQFHNCMRHIGHKTLKPYWLHMLAQQSLCQCSHNFLLNKLHRFHRDWDHKDL